MVRTMNRIPTGRRTQVGSTRRTVLKTIGIGVTLPVLGGIVTAHETRTVVDFETDGPENLAIDADGNIYMTMNFSGEIRKLSVDDATGSGLDIGATDLITTLDPGPDGFITGIVEDDGTLYVALSSFDSGQDDHGIWKITQDGGVNESLLADLSLDRLPNGVLRDEREERLLVTDSFLGEILSISLPGGDVDVWLDDELLDPDTFIGANGLAVDKQGDVFVANLDFGRIVRVPVNDDGSAGEPEPFVEDGALVGADGLTFQNGTTLYVAVNGQDKVVRVTPSGEIQTVVDGDDGLDFPADVAFGTVKQTSGTLFIANFALNPDTSQIDGNPSLMSTHP